MMTTSLTNEDREGTQYFGQGFSTAVGIEVVVEQTVGQSFAVPFEFSGRVWLWTLNLFA